MDLDYDWEIRHDTSAQSCNSFPGFSVDILFSLATVTLFLLSYCLKLQTFLVHCELNFKKLFSML